MPIKNENEIMKLISQKQKKKEFLLEIKSDIRTMGSVPAGWELEFINNNMKDFYDKISEESLKVIMPMMDKEILRIEKEIKELYKKLD